MRQSNLATWDYFTIPNALGLVPEPVPPVPATVSFDVRWFGVTQRAKVADPELDFGGQFIEDHSTIWWSASQSGFHFVSDSAATSSSYISVLGKERNGVFFTRPG